MQIPCYYDALNSIQRQLDWSFILISLYLDGMYIILIPFIIMALVISLCGCCICPFHRDAIFLNSYSIVHEHSISNRVFLFFQLFNLALINLLTFFFLFIVLIFSCASSVLFFYHQALINRHDRLVYYQRYRIRLSFCLRVLSFIG